VSGVNAVDKKGDMGGDQGMKSFETTWTKTGRRQSKDRGFTEQGSKSICNMGGTMTELVGAKR